MARAPRFHTLPDLAWPAGVRCVVNFTLDYDAQLARRVANEPPMEIAEGEFGGRTGIWRLMDLCSAHEVGLTLFVPGRICELYPASLREAAARGFELASHMWEHRVPPEPEWQRDHLRRTTAALEAITGRRPIGQRARGWGFDSLAEQGYRYISSYTADDKPYYMHEGGLTMLNLPFQWALDDAAYYKFAWLHGVAAAQRISDPDAVYENWLAAFRRTHEMGGYMNLCVHDLQSGRAGRIAMLDRLLREMKRHEGVWFATCEQVARHCLEHFPPPRTEVA